MHVVILLLSLIVLVHGLGPDQPNGKYETEDGSACVWFELRKSERGRMFVTACHCKDGDGHRQSYSCEYSGSMEECSAYQTNPRDFYSLVETQLKGNY